MAAGDTPKWAIDGDLSAVQSIVSSSSICSIIHKGGLTMLHLAADVRAPARPPARPLPTRPRTRPRTTGTTTELLERQPLASIELPIRATIEISRSRLALPDVLIRRSLARSFVRALSRMATITLCNISSRRLDVM